MLGQGFLRGGQGPVVAPRVREARQLVHQNRDLHDLDVFEFGVPVDVGVRDDHARPGCAVLEEGGHGDVVFGHHAVEDVWLALHVRPVDGRVRKVDQLLFEQDVFGRFVEDGASIHKLCLAFGHGARTRLGPEEPFVAFECKFPSEMLVKVLLVELLQADEVGRDTLDSFHDDIPSVLPIQDFCRCVGVMCPADVFITEDVPVEYRNRLCGFGVVEDVEWSLLRWITS